MKNLKSTSIFIIGLSLILFAFSQTAHAEVLDEDKDLNKEPLIFIPEEEYFSYFDANNIYTVVGIIKNFEEFPISPTVIVTIQDDDKTVSKSFEYVAVFPTKDLPFKVKFPEVKSKTPILEKPEIAYVPTQREPTNIEVLYDNTLVKYDDGHLTGRIINKGNSTVYNVKVFAIINGYEEPLDMGQNIEMITKMEPGEIREFSMYPDSSITAKVFYYSCFAPSDTTIVPVYTKRNGEKFYFRYDAGSWYYDAQFNEKGTELTMKTQTSFSLETYANFEFPQSSEDEKFNVFLNGKPKEFFQSIDERGNWHVAFTVEPRETGKILITGFAKGYDPGEGILIPDWVKFNSGWWADGRIGDSDFVRGIEFLIKENIIKVSDTSKGQNQETTIPDWIRNNAKWWSEGKINDADFVSGLQYMIKHGIISV